MKGRIKSTQIGSVNGNNVLSRTMEAFEAYFHVHDSTDEMFIALSGQMIVDLDDQSIQLNEGESFTVVSGIRHRARAPTWAKALVISR